jgi:hypothetical protein
MQSELISLVIAIISGLAAAIPLVANLIKYVEKSIKEKNWKDLLSTIISWMETAEAKFDEGAEREEWVITMVKASADSINYDIDIDEVQELIQKLCEMSKVVNAPGESLGDGVND